MRCRSQDKRLVGRARVLRNEFPVGSSPHLEGYQGYVPAIAAENLHGATFGKITGAVRKGEIQKGDVFTPEERFKSSHMAYYGNPRDKVMRNPLEPEPEEDPSASEAIPQEVFDRFWGAGAGSGAASDKQLTKKKQWTTTFQSRRKK